MADLRDKDDLHTAIIAVSIIEASLEKLIISRLHKSDNTLIKELFNRRGPLSDFNSKILIAQAFGIITEPLAGEMHSMRVIRNAFAHAKVLISFDDAPVKKEVDALKLLIAMRSVTKGPDVENGIALNLSGKNWFLLTVRIVLIMIDTIVGLKGTADQIIEDALRESPTNENKGQNLMSLSFTDDSHTTLHGTLYRAKGSQGEDIIVNASHEVLKDYGEAAVQQKASDKYDAGDISENKLTVRTTDFP